MIPNTTAGSPVKYEQRIELIPSTRLTRARSLIATGPRAADVLSSRCAGVFFGVLARTGRGNGCPQVGRRLPEIAGEVVLVGDDLRHADLFAATGALATQTSAGRLSETRYFAPQPGHRTSTGIERLHEFGPSRAKENSINPTFPRWILVGRCGTLRMTNLQPLDRSINDSPDPASIPSRLGTSILLPTRSEAQTFLSGIPDKSHFAAASTASPCCGCKWTGSKPCDAPQNLPETLAWDRHFGHLERHVLHVLRHHLTGGNGDNGAIQRLKSISERVVGTCHSLLPLLPPV